MKIAIGSDHAGFEIKKIIVEYLKNKNHEIYDKGTHSTESVDYPDFGHAVACAVKKKEADLGIVICGSGNGINMSANKHQGIRSALCWNPEIARLAKQHNNANILALPGRFVSPELAIEIVEAFLNTEFEGGRHQRRIEKIDALKDC
jgi:ribose 5-phosphate isomerase B